MSGPSERPSLKVKISSAHMPASNPTSSATPKLTLKLGAKSTTPSTVAAKSATPKEKKPPRKSRAKGKGPADPASPSTTTTTTTAAGPGPGGKKRVNDEVDDDDDDDDGQTAVATTAEPAVKKIKFVSSLPNKIRIKAKGKPPVRPLGVGYDSESSDREIDPAIEQEFILRMPPGEDCDYLRQAIREKRLGARVKDGGADVSMKFFGREGRRAMVTIRRRHYAATMVDLPAVIEGLKSWDRKGWWKSADLCQMLLVFDAVADEEAAQTIPLPSVVDPKTYQYPHGLTPPLYDARKRRFRDRVSNRTIEAVEEEVDRLIHLDGLCDLSTYEILDQDQLTRENSVLNDHGGYDMLGNAGMHEEDYDDDDDDAEGEPDDGVYEIDDHDRASLEADLEMALMAESLNNNHHHHHYNNNNSNDHQHATVMAAAAANANATSNMAMVAAPTPSAADATGDDDSSSDANDDEPDDVQDEDAIERQREMQRRHEEMADLEQAIKNETDKLSKLSNVLLRQRLAQKIRSLQADLDMKRGTTGLDEEE